MVNIQRTVGEQTHMVGADVYRSVQCPVLLIGAEHSAGQRAAADEEGRLGTWPFNRDATAAIESRFSHVRSVWMPCGHDIPHERPVELATELREFARGIREPAGS